MEYVDLVVVDLLVCVVCGLLVSLLHLKQAALRIQFYRELNAGDFKAANRTSLRFERAVLGTVVLLAIGTAALSLLVYRLVQ